MTREEARSWIIDHWGNDLEDGTKQSEVVKICLSALSDKGEWIPVSERLPEKNEWVLVSIEQPSGNCYQEIMLIDKYRGLWTDNFDYYADYVKAWMPLPEPYKAEKGGE